MHFSRSGTEQLCIFSLYIYPLFFGSSIIVFMPIANTFQNVNEILNILVSLHIYTVINVQLHCVKLKMQNHHLDLDISYRGGSMI